MRKRTNRTGRLPRRGEAGFTLIELLVVIAILGILAGVVVFATQGVDDKGEEAAEEMDARTIATAEEAFCAKYGRYATLDELSNPPGGGGGFLSDVPEQPLNQVVLNSGGNCVGTDGDPTASGFSIGETPSSDTVVDVAANEDRWDVSDTGSGPDYDSSAFAYPLNSNIYEPLIIMGSDYSLKPGLAVSWELIPVGDSRKPVRPYPTSTWRFHLRQGVTFHDGSAFDADDVIWTWRDRMPLNQSPLSTVSDTLGYSLPYKSRNLLAGNLDSVEKIDQYTVDFTPKVENLRLPEQIVHPKGAIVPATGLAPASDPQPLAAAGAPTPLPRTVGQHLDGTTGGYPNGSTALGDPTTVVNGIPYGTGPFDYVSWNVEVSAETRINTSYWGQPPQVAGMKYTFMIDSAARTSALLSGQYDMAIDLAPLDVDTVEAAAGTEVVTAPYGQNMLIYVNKVVKYGPGDDPKYDLGANPVIRRAVSLSFDRQEMVDVVYDGNASPGRWMAPPGILGTHQNDVPAMVFDQPLARQILDADGWTCGGGAPGANTPCGANEYRQKGGRILHLKLIGPPDLPQVGFDLLTARMKEIGIELEAIRYATATLRGAAYNSTNWDLNLELPNQNDANPAFLPVLRMACVNETTTFRFAPVDGTNGIGPSVNDTAANGDGRFPFGKTPCTTAGAVLGPFDTTYVQGSNAATTQDGAQSAAANQMRILVGQNETNVVIPVAGQWRIYGLGPGMGLGDPHPSQTSQRWDSLTKTPSP